MDIPIKWVYRISFLYLLVPFLIFCLGFLRYYVSIPVTLLFLWVILKFWRHASQESQVISLSKRAFGLVLFAVLLWVALSGIGGFAFQNTDFHIRNAIFRDLIDYPWPVKYFTDPAAPSIAYTLTYYIGFWLPAALVGKIAGWVAGNIALYFLSVLGVLLMLFALASKIKLFPAKIALVLIFFSGMDALGTLLVLIAVPGTSNTLWPPIFHLEWWLPGFDFQYSSFTTQLFWIFNQAIPVWLCMALIIVYHERKSLFLIWSLCCFFAPLPALGMFPYTILKIPTNLFDSEDLRIRTKFRSVRDFFSRLWLDIRALLSAENILGGGLVLGLTLLYFLSNVQSSSASSSRVEGAGWIVYAIFLVFEGLLLWGILAGRYKMNLNWYLAGVLFIAVPLINLGAARDFGMRASIPTLFMLMVWSAETLSVPGLRVRAGLFLLLGIGALTSLYEINRSVYRTASYYLDPPTSAEKLVGQQLNIYVPPTFEFDHPFTLTADSYKSLANYPPQALPNFLARANQSFFETWLLK
jgi:hypothetical protein